MAHYIYRVKDQSGVVVYVGESCNVAQRAFSHEHHKQGLTLEYTSVSDKPYGLLAEAALIKHYMPAINKMNYKNRNLPTSELESIINSAWIEIDGFGSNPADEDLELSILTAKAFKVAMESSDITYKESAIMNGIKPEMVYQCRKIYNELGASAIDKFAKGECVAIKGNDGSIKNVSVIKHAHEELYKKESVKFKKEK